MFSANLFIYLSIFTLSEVWLLCCLTCSPSLPCVQMQFAPRLLLPVDPQEQAVWPSHRLLRAWT